MLQQAGPHRSLLSGRFLTVRGSSVALNGCGGFYLIPRGRMVSLSGNTGAMISHSEASSEYYERELEIIYITPVL